MIEREHDNEPDPDPAPELYREGHEFVVCDECKSHIELDGRADYLDHAFADDPDEPRTESFGCDWEECGASFFALVYPPDHASPGEGGGS